MPLKNRLSLLALVIGGCFATVAGADISINAEDDQKAKQKVSKLTWADENDLARKEETVERLGQRHFGQSLRHNTSDLELLQRIADHKLIKQNDVENLQALGVVLGNTLKDELGLEWKIYTDAKGRSRAVCVPDTEYCLFPMTMLSRRLEVGVPVDVDQVYADAVQAIDPYLPDQNAYDGVKPDPSDKPGWLKDRKTGQPPIRIRVQ
ncbi:DUF3806 domain-containing protein [Proteobacteria bacterium 005FR1]|nr:DUF3806 domain-containing protein [Proteobacteria bacterium 005FR1]